MADAGVADADAAAGAADGAARLPQTRSLRPGARRMVAARLLRG